MSSLTYLIQQGNYLKIGYTSNLKNRLKQYNTCNADYKLLCVINGDYEVELQSKFKDLKYRDEWFHYSDSIIEQFNLYKDVFSTFDKNNSTKNNRYSKKITPKNIKKFISICKKYVWSPEEYIISSDPRIESELDKLSLLNMKSKLFKILLDKKILIRTRKGFYVFNNAKNIKQ